MRVIVGLGNFDHPGTRHNVGYDFVDYLKEKYGKTKDWLAVDNLDTEELQGHVAAIEICGHRLLLFKPILGNINNSGKPLHWFLKTFDEDIKDVLIVHDELDLRPGQFKFKEKAGSARHNAIKNIKSYFGNNFARLKIGIGRPEKREPALDYVLSPPYNSQMDDVKISLVEAAEALEFVIQNSLQEAMSKFNGESDVH